MMICRTLFLFLLLLRVLWAADTNTARVSVQVRTSANDIIDDATIELHQLGTQLIIGNFEDGAAEGIPYSYYMLNVHVPGFRIFEQELIVAQAQVDVQVEMVLAETTRYAGVPEPRTIKGRVASATQGLWVNLVPLISNGNPPMEARVDDDGGFRLSGMVQGRYLLLVLRDRKLLAARVVDVLQSSEVTIELPERNADRGK